MPNKLITAEEAAKRFADKINSISDKRVKKAIVEWFSKAIFRYRKPRWRSSTGRASLP